MADYDFIKNSVLGTMSNDSLLQRLKGCYLDYDPRYIKSYMLFRDYLIIERGVTFEQVFSIEAEITKLCRCKALLVKADGTITETSPKNGKNFVWQDAKEKIGGYVQYVYPDSERTMIVDEDGLLKQLPINQVATTIAHQTIVGDVILCDNSLIPD